MRSLRYQHRFQRCLQAAAVSLAAVLALTGCGGGSSDSAAGAPSTVTSQDLTPVAAVEKIAEASQQTESAAYEFEMSGAGLATKGRGSYATQPELALEMIFDSMSMEGAPDLGGMAGMEQRIIGDTLYMKLPGAAGAMLGGKWMKLSFADAGAAAGLDLESLLAQSTQADPRKQIQTLLAAGNIAEVGQETIDGVATTHYSGELDPDQLADSAEVDAQTREALADMYAAAGITGTKLDVWVDEQYRPRRFVSTSATGRGAMTMTMTFADYGKDVTVVAPPAGQVTDMADLMGDLMDGAAGSGA